MHLCGPPEQASARLLRGWHRCPAAAGLAPLPGCCGAGTASYPEAAGVEPRPGQLRAASSALNLIRAGRRTGSPRRSRRVPSLGADSVGRAGGSPSSGEEVQLVLQFLVEVMKVGAGVRIGSDRDHQTPGWQGHHSIPAR